MAIDYKPQIVPEAIEFLESILQPGWRVFEYGSGQSTVFFARRVAEMVSVEHHPDWVETVNGLLAADGLEITYLYRPQIPGIGTRNAADPFSYRCGEGDTADWKDYVVTIDQYPDSYFDLVFVDGGARCSCMYHAHRKIGPGGYLLLDDSERKWYYESLECLFASWERYDFSGVKGMDRAPSQATFWRRNV